MIDKNRIIELYNDIMIQYEHYKSDMNIKNDVELTYDDVLIKPNFSEIQLSSRKMIKDTSIKYRILNAPMKSVVQSPEWAYNYIKSFKTRYIMHRFDTLDNIIKFHQDVRKIYDENNTEDIFMSSSHLFIQSIGLDSSYDEWVDYFYNNGNTMFLIDIANGYLLDLYLRVIELKNKYPHIILLTGNIVSAEGYLLSVLSGTNAVRVGIGPSSVCTTRLVTGVGRPQISAIKDINNMKNFIVDNNILEKYYIADVCTIPSIIADGGINTVGDISKAFVAGADMVMLGKYLADVTENEVDGKIYYYGSASKKNTMSNRYNEGIDYSFEGSHLSLMDKANNIVDGVSSMITYVGVDSIENLIDAELIRISNSTLRENSVGNR